MQIRNNKINTNKEDNYIYMLIGLLALILLHPVLDKWFPAATNIFTTYSFVALMFIGVWSFLKNRTLFNIGMTLATLGLFFSTLNIFLKLNPLFLISHFTILSFCILSVVVGITNILFSGSITTNKIIGSINIYLLLGIIWAEFYVFIAYVDPSAFNGIELSAAEGLGSDFIYFSFVTLTTLGYGDISPASDVTRAVAYLEAICGQFYLTILVASLVGAHLADQNNVNQDNE
jgi:voltage-gated potassium channel